MRRFFALALLVSLFPTAVWSAQPAQRADIVTTAAQAGSFKTLVTALVATDLTDALKGQRPFTVFAPTDEAFAKLPKGTLEKLLAPEGRDQLTAILKYHVLPTVVSIPRTPPSHPLTSATTLNGAKLKFDRKGHDVKVNQANIVKTNIHCSNGIIHVIDAVLLPPMKNDVVSVAKNAGTFQTLVAALEAADLTQGLQGEGPITVFAPTDEAFAKLPKGTLKSLLEPENKATLRNILLYHVVKGRVKARDAIVAGEAETLAKSKVTITINDGRLLINESKAIKTDLEADNGVIHVIDTVLLPPGLDNQKPRR